MADTFGMVHPELEAFEQPNLMSHIAETFKLVDERLVNSERLIEEQRILIEEQRIIEQDIEVQRIARENNRWRRVQRVQRVHARDIADLQKSVTDMRVRMDANAGESHSSPSADRPILSADGSVPSAVRPTPSADRPTPGPNRSPLAARTVQINERRRQIPFQNRVRHYLATLRRANSSFLTSSHYWTEERFCNLRDFLCSPQYRHRIERSSASKVIRKFRNFLDSRRL